MRGRFDPDVRKYGLMTDKQLADLLPTLPLEKRIETVIAKYVGGALSSVYDGETTSDVADAKLAAYLVRKMRPWLIAPAAPSPQ